MLTLTFKTTVEPIGLTENYIERAFGVRRWVWNWALSRFKREKKTTNNLPDWYDLIAELRADAKLSKDNGFAWLVEQFSSQRIWEETMKDVQASFVLCRKEQKEVNKRFYSQLHKPRKKKIKKKIVQPKFKSRKDRVQSFSMYHALDRVFRIEGEHTISFAVGRDAKLKRGILRTSESLAFLRKPGIKLCRMTVKRDGKKLWLMISYERPNRKKPEPSGGSIGIDLGVKKSVVSYDGMSIETHSFNTKRSIALERKADKLNKKMSHLKYGSNKYEKVCLLYAERKARAARIRKYNLEKCTSFIAQNYKNIMIDDFAFNAAMEVAERKELYRCMKYEFKLRLEQKAQERGGILKYVQHAKGEKTTHICSRCGSLSVEKRDDRIIHCRHCGLDIDRDENGAINSFKLI